MQTQLGQAYVQKDKDTAFCSPVVELNSSNEELFASWINTHKTIQEWTELFADVVVKTKDDANLDPLRGIRVTVDEFEKKAEAVTRDLDFKYPSNSQQFEKGGNDFFCSCLAKIRAY